MVQSILTTLKYETEVAPGAYFRLATDWFDDHEEVTSIIIDQNNVFSKIISIYPNGFVMYLEQFPEGSLYRTNYPLYMNENKDFYHVDWDVDK